MHFLNPTRAEKLAEIRKRVKNATPGLWCDIFTGSGVDRYDIGRFHEMKDDRHVIATCDVEYGDGVPAVKRHPKQVRADIAFIAHARQDIPFLLAELERLEKENRELRRARRKS